MRRVESGSRPKTTGSSKPGHRFRRQQRLLTSDQYRRVFAKGRRSADAMFTVLGVPNGGRAPRLGLAISKKSAKLAVARNRLKRIARETFRQLDDLPAWDFVVMARGQAMSHPNEKLRLSLRQHFINLAAPAADRHG